MKKSKAITLVLVSAAIVGCSQKHEEKSRLYMRTDSTSGYRHGHMGFLGYYVFRPFGFYSGGSYMRQGYSNAGMRSSSSSGISRGGFGSTAHGFHVSS